MRAIVFTKPGAPATAETLPRPVPGADEILIRVRACGICHGDLMAQQGAFPFARYPLVPGHEVAGVVEEIGTGVKWPEPGMRVGLSVLYSTCGRCKHCLAGSENLCPGLEWTGVMHNGGYAEYVTAKAEYVVPLPESLSFVEAAPLMCAGLTVYSGLVRGGFAPGNRVAVIGLGGLGNLGVLFARAMGGRVAVVSRDAGKEAEARDSGAEFFVDAQRDRVSDKLRAWEGGADIILASAPSVESATEAFGGLAPDGTLVILGVGPGSIQINPMELVMGRRRLIGSPAGSRKELRDCVDFAAHHGIRPKVRTLPLEDAGKALSAMQDGHMFGRTVLVMD